MEKKQNTFFIFVFLLMTLFGTLVAIIMMFSLFGVFSSQKLYTSDNIPEADIGVSNKNIILGETSDYGQEYIDRIIFLGESTTYGLQSYGVLKDGVNTTQVWTGATTKYGKTVSAGTMSLSPAIVNTKIFFPDTQTAMTIKEALEIKNPEYLIITLGLNNGASYYSEKEFKYCYRLLLDTIRETSKDTTIILQSLFPVSKSCTIKAYTPQRLATCNEWLYDIAREYDLRYLNTSEALSDTDGYLKDNFDNGGDGIHLNKEGLLTVIEYIKRHGVPEEKQ